MQSEDVQHNAPNVIHGPWAEQADRARKICRAIGALLPTISEGGVVAFKMTATLVDGSVVNYSLSEDFSGSSPVIGDSTV